MTSWNRRVTPPYLLATDALEYNEYRRERRNSLAGTAPLARDAVEYTSWKESRLQELAVERALAGFDPLARDCIDRIKRKDFDVQRITQGLEPLARDAMAHMQFKNARQLSMSVEGFKPLATDVEADTKARLNQVQRRRRKYETYKQSFGHPRAAPWTRNFEDYAPASRDGSLVRERAAELGHLATDALGFNKLRRTNEAQLRQNFDPLATDVMAFNEYRRNHQQNMRALGNDNRDIPFLARDGMVVLKLDATQRQGLGVR